MESSAYYTNILVIRYARPNLPIAINQRRQISIVENDWKNSLIAQKTNTLMKRGDRGCWKMICNRVLNHVSRQLLLQVQFHGKISHTRIREARTSTYNLLTCKYKQICIVCTVISVELIQIGGSIIRTALMFLSRSSCTESFQLFLISEYHYASAGRLTRLKSRKRYHYRHKSNNAARDFNKTRVEFPRSSAFFPLASNYHSELTRFQAICRKSMVYLPRYISF